MVARSRTNALQRWLALRLLAIDRDTAPSLRLCNFEVGLAPATILALDHGGGGTTTVSIQVMTEHAIVVGLQHGIVECVHLPMWYVRHAQVQELCPEGLAIEVHAHRQPQACKIGSWQSCPTGLQVIHASIRCWHFPKRNSCWHLQLFGGQFSQKPTLLLQYVYIYIYIHIYYIVFKYLLSLLLCLKPYSSSARNNVLYTY